MFSINASLAREPIFDIFSLISPAQLGVEDSGATLLRACESANLFIDFFNYVVYNKNKCLENQ